jgi:excisionase family DNA binding protein
VTYAELLITDKALLTVEEVAEVIGLKRTATYVAVHRGQIPSLRLGRRLFVPVPALLRLLGHGDTQFLGDQFERNGGGE